MKKYFLMFGLTLVMGLFISINVVAQQGWLTSPPNYSHTADWVGVGTAAPEAQLHIVDNNRVDFFLSRSHTNNQPTGRFRIINPATGDIFNLVMRRAGGVAEMIQSAYDGVNGQWREYAYLNMLTGEYIVRPGIEKWLFRNSGDILFYNGEGTGNVGIGYLTMPSGAKFAVNGDIIADGKITSKEVEVKLDVWPDFVFSSDYYLRPLNEVEQFIKANSHLPDVPSEVEVLANGVNVGEMSATLLQKIEELTLYIIDLNKRIAELEK